MSRPAGASSPAPAPRSVYRSMLGLHAWAGLVLGWVSYLVFLTGTLAYFQPEITQWMQPQLQRPHSLEQGLTTALGRLAAVAPAADEWIVRLPTQRDPSLDISWRSADPQRFRRELLNGATGEPVKLTETLGGRLFYSFHFTLMVPGFGYWIVGAAAMFMLVALVTGVIIHRKVFADFFTFRPRHSPRRAWLDVHNLSSVLALPFHLAIIYTGFVTLLYSYVPSIMHAAYPDGRGFFGEAFVPKSDNPKPTQHEIPLEELAAQLRVFESAGTSFSDLRIAKPGTADALVSVEVTHENRRTFATQRNVSGIANLYDSLYEFHLGRFADWGIRWLLFASGLAGSAMIATGLLVWSLKRRERAAGAASRIGCFVVDRLNVAVVGGALLAIAAFFFANRLLPAALDGRGVWELRCFYTCWAGAALHAFVRPLRHAWREQLWLAAAAFAALPLVSSAVTGRGLFTALSRQDWLFVGFDAVALTTAACAGVAAFKLSRRSPAVAPRATGAATMAAEPAA